MITAHQVIAKFPVKIYQHQGDQKYNILHYARKILLCEKCPLVNNAVGS